MCLPQLVTKCINSRIAFLQKNQVGTPSHSHANDNDTTWSPEPVRTRHSNEKFTGPFCALNHMYFSAGACTKWSLRTSLAHITRACISVLLSVQIHHLSLVTFYYLTCSMMVFRPGTLRCGRLWQVVVQDIGILRQAVQNLAVGGQIKEGPQVSAGGEPATHFSCDHASSNKYGNIQHSLNRFGFGHMSSK